MESISLLAISGSLRAASSNTAIIEAAAAVAPLEIRIALWRGVAELPHFNPDVDDGDPTRLPPSVTELRRRIGAADGLLISTPEYAHGLPGSLKNALDWLVGSMEFPGKPVAILNPSARSVHAPAQLREILATMSARLVEPMPFIIPLPSRDMTTSDIVADTALVSALRATISAIAQAILLPGNFA